MRWLPQFRRFGFVALVLVTTGTGLLGAWTVFYRVGYITEHFSLSAMGGTVGVVTIPNEDWMTPLNGPYGFDCYRRARPVVDWQWPGYQSYDTGMKSTWGSIWCVTIPAAFGAFLLRPRRLPPGNCQRCGYNLRASPIRCPECGEPAQTTRAGPPN